MSVNAIVIFVLAFVFLAAGLVFIKKVFPSEIPKIPTQCEIYPPTENSPICISSNLVLDRGSEYELGVALFNDEEKDISAEILPVITCSPNIDGEDLGLQYTSIGTDVSIKEVGEYSLIVKVPKETKTGLYPCRLQISETSKPFSVTVE